jgi:hypothetical protein
VLEKTDQLLTLQAGVVSRRQLLARGWVDHDIARMLRRRLWTRMREGVYVHHTGEPTWLQHAWAAVLFSWPAALSHESSLRASIGPGHRDVLDLPVHVMVERDRRLVQPSGVLLHRRATFATQVQWNLGPPRVRYEEAALDVALGARSELSAVAILAQAGRVGPIAT